MKKLIAIAAMFLITGCTGIGWVQPVPHAANPNHPVCNMANPCTVLLVGDSLMYQAGPYINNRVDTYSLPFEVINKAVPGSGLLTTYPSAPPGQEKNYFYAPAPMIQSWIWQYDPDFVIVEYAGNDWGPSRSVSQFPFLSTAWYNSWWNQVNLIVNDIRDAGATPILVRHPPTGPNDPWTSHRDYLARGMEFTAWIGGTGFANWWRALEAKNGQVWLDDGSGPWNSYYADWLKYPEDGGSCCHVVRNGDQLHMVNDGAERVTRWTVTTLSTYVD